MHAPKVPCHSHLGHFIAYRVERHLRDEEHTTLSEPKRVYVYCEYVPAQKSEAHCDAHGLLSADVVCPNRL